MAYQILVNELILNNDFYYSGLLIHTSTMYNCSSCHWYAKFIINL